MRLYFILISNYYCNEINGQFTAELELGQMLTYEKLKKYCQKKSEIEKFKMTKNYLFLIFLYSGYLIDIILSVDSICNPNEFELYRQKKKKLSFWTQKIV